MPLSLTHKNMKVTPGCHRFAPVRIPDLLITRPVQSTLACAGLLFCTLLQPAVFCAAANLERLGFMPQGSLSPDGLHEVASSRDKGSEKVYHDGRLIGTYAGTSRESYVFSPDSS